jgi:hypothetical protein
MMTRRCQAKRYAYLRCRTSGSTGCTKPRPDQATMPMSQRGSGSMTVGNSIRLRNAGYLLSGNEHPHGPRVLARGHNSQLGHDKWAVAGQRSRDVLSVEGRARQFDLPFTLAVGKGRKCGLRGIDTNQIGHFGWGDRLRRGDLLGTREESHARTVPIRSEPVSRSACVKGNLLGAHQRESCPEALRAAEISAASQRPCRQHPPRSG